MVQLVEKPFQLLVADDNEGLRRTICEVLQRSVDVQLHEVDSGEAAVEYVRDQRIDIVLLDMHMQRLSGLETIRILKSLDQLRPCILITSDTDEQLSQEAHKADAFDVLHKPIERQRLVTTVTTALATTYHSDHDESC